MPSFKINCALIILPDKALSNSVSQESCSCFLLEFYSFSFACRPLSLIPLRWFVCEVWLKFSNQERKSMNAGWYVTSSTPFPKEKRPPSLQRTVLEYCSKLNWQQIHISIPELSLPSHWFRCLSMPIPHCINIDTEKKEVDQTNSIHLIHSEAFHSHSEY